MRRGGDQGRSNANANHMKTILSGSVTSVSPDISSSKLEDVAIIINDGSTGGEHSRSVSDLFNTQIHLKNFDKNLRTKIKLMEFGWLCKHALKILEKINTNMKNNGHFSSLNICCHLQYKRCLHLHLLG